MGENLGLGQEELELQGTARLELISFEIFKNFFVSSNVRFFNPPIGMQDKLNPSVVFRMDANQDLVVVKNSFEVLRNSFCHGEFRVWLKIIQKNGE